MPQNPQDITNSQEFKDFCKNNNLEVFNIESINLALYNQSRNIKELENGFFSLDKLVATLQESFSKLAEMAQKLMDKWK